MGSGTASAPIAPASMATSVSRSSTRRFPRAIESRIHRSAGRFSTRRPAAHSALISKADTADTKTRPAAASRSRRRRVRGPIRDSPPRPKSTRGYREA